MIDHLLQDKNSPVLLYVAISCNEVTNTNLSNVYGKAFMVKEMINAVLLCFAGLLQESDNPYSRFENE